MHKAIFSMLAVLITFSTAEARTIEHYIFYGADREKMRTDKMLDEKFFAGAQVSYLWRQLETGRDEYDLSMIRDDVKFLASKGKRLWIHVQDVTFTDPLPAPRYL